MIYVVSTHACSLIFFSLKSAVALTAQDELKSVSLGQKEKNCV